TSTAYTKAGSTARACARVGTDTALLRAWGIATWWSTEVECCASRASAASITASGSENLVPDISTNEEMASSRELNDASSTIVSSSISAVSSLALVATGEAAAVVSGVDSGSDSGSGFGLRRWETPTSTKM